MKDFLRRYQILAHLVFLTAVMFGAYIFLRALDPRIGVEGFGDLFGFLRNAVGLAVVIFTCRWFKNNVWHDLSKKAEEDLQYALLFDNKPGAWKAKLFDRLEWAFLLIFVYKVIFNG